MAYRIEYGPPVPVQYQARSNKHSLQVMTAVFLLLFTLLVKVYYPAGTAKLREFLLPGMPSVTQQALETMVSELRDGDPLRDAFTAFCEQIISDDKTLTD